MTIVRRAREVPQSRSSLVARHVARGQIGFALFIAICVCLHPGLVLKANEGGMSNFGVHLKTVVPYTVALCFASILSFRASQFLQANTRQARQLKTLLRSYSALILLTLFSTYGYTLNTPLKVIHFTLGVMILAFESVASLWMYRALHSWGVVVIIQYVGLILAALTWSGQLHVLFLTEVVTGVAFALLLVRTTRETASLTMSDAVLDDVGDVTKES
jgi:hypothetical protein